MWLRVLLMGACLGGLSACAVVDPVDSRVDTISRSLAKARNEAIFLNLLRASHDHPLSFVTVANVTPSLTNTSALGLPSFLLGPPALFGAAPGSISSLPNPSPGRDVIFGSSTASNATAVSTNFNVSTQETSAFYDGFLKPIDLRVLDYFIRQGYSRELLFWLFADAFEINIQGQLLGTRYNPPGDFGCIPADRKRRCFRHFILGAIAAGLTVEEQILQKSAKDAGKHETHVFARFCFSPVLAERARNAMGELLYRELTTKYADFAPAASQPKCGSAWDPVKQADKPQPDTHNWRVGTATFKIVPRSAYGVFEFLGTLIRMQREHPVPTANVYGSPEQLAEEQKGVKLRTARAGEDQDLVRVVATSDAVGRCFVQTWFYDGDYCVPEDATNTKRIFSLLAQLIAIQTAVTDLSITPVVRVVQ